MVLSEVISTSMPALYFVLMKIYSTPVSRSKWIVQKLHRTDEFFGFLNHSKLITPHIFILCDRRGYRWGESLVHFAVVFFKEGEDKPHFHIIFISQDFYHIIVHYLFRGFKNAQKPPSIRALQKRCFWSFSKYCKVYRKTPVHE